MHQPVSIMQCAQKSGNLAARLKGGFTCSARAPEGRYLLYIKSSQQGLLLGDFPASTLVVITIRAMLEAPNLYRLSSNLAFFMQAA